MPRDLVERAMAGDHEAFSELARLVVRRLYAVARLILRDDARAEDAVQEALVACWRDLSGLRDPDRFEAWIHRLLVRQCYREARRERRRIEVEGMVRHLGPSVDIGHQQALRDQIERGFARLPVDQRTVLVLHHLIGYSYPEIGEILDVPVGTAKSRLSRASAAMRDALADGSHAPNIAGGAT